MSQNVRVEIYGQTYSIRTDLNPDYIRRLFEPGWIRLLPITAVIMMILGFLIIRRIVDIDV